MKPTTDDFKSSIAREASFRDVFAPYEKTFADFWKNLGAENLGLSEHLSTGDVAREEKIRDMIKACFVWALPMTDGAKTLQRIDYDRSLNANTTSDLYFYLQEQGIDLPDRTVSLGVMTNVAGMFRNHTDIVLGDAFTASHQPVRPQMAALWEKRPDLA